MTWLIQSNHQYKIITSKYFSDLLEKTEHKPKVMEKKHMDVLLGFIPSSHSFKLLMLYYCFQRGQALTGGWFGGCKSREKVDLWRVTLLCPGRQAVTMDTGCGRWVDVVGTTEGPWHRIHRWEEPSPPQKSGILHSISCNVLDTERHVLWVFAFPANCLNR